MVEGKELSYVLCAPLKGRGKQPAQGEDEPPEEGSHHGVVEKTKDNNAIGVLPGPSYGGVDKLTTWTCDSRTTNRHGDEIGKRVDTECYG